MKGFGCMYWFSLSPELSCAMNAAVAGPVLLAETWLDRSWQLLATGSACLISGDRDVQARWTLGNSRP